VSARLGERIRLPEDQIRALRRAGIVHDIGKVVVPDAILLKPGPLSDEEIAIMRRHPVVGEKICEPLRTFGAVLPIIRHHHERFDGSGYPDGLRGDDIPLTARVLQLADVFDALTTDRPYRKADPPETALDIMAKEASRGWWDRTLLEEFTVMIRGDNASAPKRTATALD
jgi:cyclic di-GMP phosphodiesterase